MVSKAIVGPVLKDVVAVGLRGDRIVLATAFYSKAPLVQIEVTASRVDLLVRLDLASIEEWVAGMIAPDALLNFVERQENDGREIVLRASGWAHAKVYWGRDGFLVGSANLTTRGLGGFGGEILWLERGRHQRDRMANALERYAKKLTPISIDELRDYVDRNASIVAKRARRERHRQTEEGRLPERIHSRPYRLGSYKDFLKWLSGRREPAAREIYERGYGKGQLSGHIYSNFQGLRQFFLARPTECVRFQKKRPDTYHLLTDNKTTGLLADFVLNEATDEEQFELDKWRTYLPERVGGKPKTGGGTSGNLNRMLPLVARYLGSRIK